VWFCPCVRDSFCLDLLNRMHSYQHQCDCVILQSERVLRMRPIRGLIIIIIIEAEEEITVIELVPIRPSTLLLPTNLLRCVGVRRQTVRPVNTVR
jgi:hypothetical protein